MTKHVWLSSALQETSLIMPVNTDISVDNEADAIKGQELNEKGLHVSSDLCPKKIWFDDSGADIKKMPDLFWAMSQWIVSEKAAKIISKFDLGQGALYPVVEGIFQSDRITRISGSYYCWTFGCVKDALLPEDSFNLRKSQVAGLWFRIPWKLKDGDVAVSRQAILGPDVWIDPMLFKSLFLSARLGNALNDAGLAASFRFSRCRVE